MFVLFVFFELFDCCCLFVTFCFWGLGFFGVFVGCFVVRNLGLFSSYFLWVLEIFRFLRF